MNDTTTIPTGVLSATHGSGLLLLSSDGDGEEYRPRHAKPAPAPTRYDDRLVALAALAASI